MGRCRIKNLRKISLSFETVSSTFTTLTSSPLVHVFVKNRRSDTSFSESNADFVSNYLAWKAVEASPLIDINPYLGTALGINNVPLFGAPAGPPIDIPLRSQPILADEVILPIVDVHLYSASYGVWTFNYTIKWPQKQGPNRRSSSPDS